MNCLWFPLKSSKKKTKLKTIQDKKREEEEEEEEGYARMERSGMRLLIGALCLNVVLRLMGGGIDYFEGIIISLFNFFLIDGITQSNFDNGFYYWHLIIRDAFLGIQTQDFLLLGTL